MGGLVHRAAHRRIRMEMVVVEEESGKTRHGRKSYQLPEKGGKVSQVSKRVAMGKRQMRQVRFTVKPRCGKYLCLASRETKTLPRSTLFVAVYVAGSDGR